MTGQRGRRERGFTLLETLVTLVIVALVAGLLSEGLFQLGRLEQRLEGGQLRAQVWRLHLLWAQQTLEGLMPGAPDGPERFAGSSRELSGVSAQLPLARVQGPSALRMTLRYRPEVGQTVLLLSQGASPAELGDGVVLARWQGDSGQWLYLDRAGAWLAQWPPAMGNEGDAVALPRAVALDRGGNQGLALLAVPQLAAQPLGRRVDAEALP